MPTLRQARPLKSGYHPYLIEVADCAALLHPEVARPSSSTAAETYGSPRIQVALMRLGCRHGRNRIARLMRQKGLCGRLCQRFQVVTTDSRHDEPVAPNRLAPAPPASQPNRIWVADITYIGTGEGWLYVAAILDLYSRRVVGWAIRGCAPSVALLAVDRLPATPEHIQC